MEKQLGFLKNIAKVIGILVFFMGIALLIEQYFVADALVPAIMALAVFVISYVTDGFLYGIIASMLSVLALNFAFAFPYFAFNFNIPENIISAVVMLAITIMTSTLTAQLKMQEKVRIESEKEKMRGNLLRAVSHDLRTPLTSISGSSAAIVDNYEQLSKEQVLQLCRGIREDSQWLIGMVENILSITRIDNQKRSMGIGLAVCASIIRAHDGVITAENRKGGGCCFRFTLDMEETE